MKIPGGKGLRTLGAILAAAALAAPAAAPAGEAFDQLCAAAGGNCDVYVPPPPPPTRVETGNDTEAAAAAEAAKRVVKKAPKITTKQMIRMTITESLVEGIIGAIFAAPSGPSPAEIEAARQAHLAELRRRAAEIQAQRQRRELDNAASMEELRAAMSEPFDGGEPFPVAAGPVQLDPGASGVVRTFDAPENPFARKPSPAEAAGAAAARRLAELAAQNPDVALLAANLQELEGQLAEVRQQAVDLKRGANWVARQYTGYEETVAQTVEEAKQRGMSMAFDGLFTGTPKALEALEAVRSNKGAWNTMVGLLRETDDAVRAASDAASTVSDRIEEAQWALGERDTAADLKFLAKKLGGDYAELGENILESAVAIRKQLEVARGLREMSGVEARYRAEIAALAPRMEEIERRTREAREAVAKRTGISARDLKPVPPPRPGLDSVVPHPND